MRRHNGHLMKNLPVVRQLSRLWDAIYGSRAALMWVGKSNEVMARAAGDHFGETLVATPKYQDPLKLNRHEGQVFSQGGEDGIISEIFRRIGTFDKRFVEFGVEDGLETNTTHLLSLGWSGVWIDADAEKLARARESFRGPIEAGRLEIVEAFVSAENSRELMQQVSQPQEFDLLSLDIDRNTYYLWKALAEFRPRVVVVEYNGSIPPADDWVVEYDATKVWNGTVHHGAGLKAYELLGRQLGYSLVGCSLSGVNAFFVRDDLVGEQFASPFTAENHHEPPRYWLQWRRGHPRAFSD